MELANRRKIVAIQATINVLFIHAYSYDLMAEKKDCLPILCVRQLCIDASGLEVMPCRAMCMTAHLAAKGGGH